MEMKIGLSFKLPIKITKRKKWFTASCPALDIVTQGDTEEQARKNIGEALHLFLRSCIERGTLDSVLKQCGFTSVKVEEPGGQPKITARAKKQEYVDIPLYLL